MAAVAFMMEGAKSTFHKARDVSTNLIKTSKPWREFTDRNSFSKVSSAGPTGRVGATLARGPVTSLPLRFQSRQ